MKRVFDFIAALLVMPIAAPAVLICALVVRMTSPGPAIFRQTRVGLHEQPFTCYKLRTMFIETRDVPTHQSSASSVTPVGKWLRALKLDELPQLWNIIRGDMSLVGPRPCLPSQVELVAARRARGLYEIRPGVTGISQVAGVDMSDPERLAELDARYLDQMSLGTDIRLILATALGAGRGDRVQN